MSNHSGSYMLNEVLQTIINMGIDEQIGKDRMRELTRKLVRIGDGYDCNIGEILEELGNKIGICYYCMKDSDDLKGDLCEECR